MVRTIYKTRRTSTHCDAYVHSKRFENALSLYTDGKLLAHGKPTGVLPSMQDRQMNYRLVKGSKYAVEADKIAQGVASE